MLITGRTCVCVAAVAEAPLLPATAPVPILDMIGTLGGRHDVDSPRTQQNRISLLVTITEAIEHICFH